MNIMISSINSNNVQSSAIQVRGRERLDPFSMVPNEIAFKILSHLRDLLSLRCCVLVNRKWHAVANNKDLWQTIPINAFGTKQWLELLGADVGEEPPLSPAILKAIKSPCPFSNDEKIKVEETHMLLLIPKTINGKQLNLNTLAELVQLKFPKLGSDFGMYGLYGLSFEQYAANSDKSRWVLLTKDVLEGSRNKSYLEQQKLIQEKGQGKYQVPYALNIAVGVFMEYARSKTHLYGNTYTRCQETIPFLDDQLIAGRFSKKGLTINNCSKNKEEYGIAAEREFF